MTSPAQLAAFLIDLAKDEEVQAEQARRLPYIPGNTVAAWRRARARELRAAAALINQRTSPPAAAGTGGTIGPTPNP